MPSAKKRHTDTAAARRSLKRKVITALLRWYRKNGRQLPWRNETDPYRVLISEVMLPQTQVSRVQSKYPEFLKKFPTFRKLASAGTSEAIRAWSGMGYNNRVLRLRNLAQTVLREFGGELPSDVERLNMLPGIGRYTANAVACFAFGEQVPVVDTNVVRIFGRLYPKRMAGLPPKAQLVWEFAQEHLPRSAAQDWNQALMDLGATVCTASRPRCEVCPLERFCPTAHAVPRRVVRRPNAEPGRRGIPNRIYRGRAIEILRSLEPGASMSSSSLGRKVVADFSRDDQTWFRSLLRRLERDGMVRLHGLGRISLPD